jgi:alpha-tubulin suppressor-like RCC1 family protein
MNRWTLVVTVRGASIALWLAGAALGVMSCKGDDIAGPTDPGGASQVGPALATAAGQALAFRQVSAGHSHSCGVTADNRTYCWGYNFFGQLGDGTATDRLTPVPVAGGLRFLQVSAGTSHSCGVTLYNRAFCWGAGYTGALGDGSTADSRPTPVRVAGRLRFRQVVAANHHTCGVTTENRAYCWGDNLYGEIGDGARTMRLKPVPVSGGLRFRHVSAGLLHTCGVTLYDRAYCWGNNSQGQLGGGPPGDLSLTPVRVVGGLRFRRVIAGEQHTCGVTPDDRAYCWGSNSEGQLGDGTTTTRLRPLPVAGGLQFRQVGAAGQHTCGVTPDDRAYCWGPNHDGQLGDGTSTLRRRPVAVAGGLRFRQVSARLRHTCGVTLGNVAYCWGSNSEGQLGDGTTTNRLRPVAVAGAM